MTAADEVRALRQPLTVYANTADQAKTVCEDCGRSWIRVFSRRWYHYCMTAGREIRIYCAELEPNWFWVAGSLEGLERLAEELHRPTHLHPIDDSVSYADVA